MIAIVVCNGSMVDYPYYKKYLDRADYIICADGGAAHARRLRIKPDALVGDFDSISKGDLDFYRDMGAEILKFPVNKDISDTELAVNMAIDRGCDSLIIFGGLGTRIDHSLSNIFLLKKLLDGGIKGIIVDERNELTLIKDNIQLEREKNVQVTLLALTEKVEGITTKGLYYPLKNSELELGSSLGISNEFVSDTAEISIKSGLLLVIKARD